MLRVSAVKVIVAAPYVMAARLREGSTVAGSLHGGPTMTVLSSDAESSLPSVLKSTGA